MRRRPGKEFQFSTQDRAALDRLRMALYRHHGQLVESAKLDWERNHGTISGPGELLQLLIGNEDFAWLRILSGLVAELDEVLDAPVADAAPNLVARVEGLFIEGAAEGDQFFARHDAFVQKTPELVFSHIELRRAIFDAHGRAYAVTRIEGDE